MKYATSHKRRNVFSPFTLCLILTTFFVHSCTDIPNAGLETTSKKAGISDKVSEAVSRVQSPVSETPAIQEGESHFIALAKKMPRFAGYHLNRQESKHVRDDKLVVWLKGDKNTASALSEVRSNIRSSFGKSLPNFERSQITIKKAKYNYYQLQAYRDILHKPIFETDGVTSVDLAEDENRIVVGVKTEKDIEATQSTVSSLPVPNEAVNIEVEGSIIPAVSRNEQTGKFTAENLLTHQTVRDRIRPITGGLKIDADDTKCTLGLIAKFGSSDVFLTNAHCGPLGSFGNMGNIPYDQGNFNIGREMRDVPFQNDNKNDWPYRHSDAAISSINAGISYDFGTVVFTNGRSNQWGEFDSFQLEILDNPPTQPSRLKYIDVQKPLIDLPVVKTGQETGASIGYVEDTCKDFDVPNLPNNQLLCQTTASPMYLKDGDSGAPVFTDYIQDIEGGEAELVGMLWGYRDSNLDGKPDPPAIFSKISRIKKDLETASKKLTFVHMSTNISGSSNITSTGNYTYDANVENYTGSVNYQWSIQWQGSSTWNQLGTNATQSVSVTGSSDYTLKLEVNDNTSSTTTQFPVTVIAEDCNPNQPPFEPCEN